MRRLCAFQAGKTPAVVDHYKEEAEKHHHHHHHRHHHGEDDESSSEEEEDASDRSKVVVLDDDDDKHVDPDYVDGEEKKTPKKKKSKVDEPDFMARTAARTPPPPPKVGKNELWKPDHLPPPKAPAPTPSSAAKREPARKVLTNIELIAAERSVEEERNKKATAAQQEKAAKAARVSEKPISPMPPPPMAAKKKKMSPEEEKSKCVVQAPRPAPATSGTTRTPITIADATGDDDMWELGDYEVPRTPFTFGEAFEMHVDDAAAINAAKIARQQREDTERAHSVADLGYLGLPQCKVCTHELGAPWWPSCGCLMCRWCAEKSAAAMKCLLCRHDVTLRAGRMPPEQEKKYLDNLDPIPAMEARILSPPDAVADWPDPLRSKTKRNA